MRYNPAMLKERTILRAHPSDITASPELSAVLARLANAPVGAFTFKEFHRIEQALAMPNGGGVPLHELERLADKAGV